MHDLLVPDFALIEKWLRESGHEFYVCDQCSGLHISAFHTLEGVLDSRVFVEPWGLLFTTEMELRASAILAVSADLPRLNMSFPTLKLFLNTPDEAPAMLVATSTILTGQGLTMAQFYEFFGVAQEVLQKLLQECQQMQFLFTESDAHLLSEPEDGINPSYH